MALCRLASLEAGTGPEPVPEQGSLILVSDNRALIRPTVIHLREDDCLGPCLIFILISLDIRV